MDIASIFKLRRHKRFMVNLDVTFVETKTGRETEAKVHDVSDEGMMIYSEDSFEAGMMLDIWLMLPAPNADSEPPILIVSGKVANCVLAPKGHYFDIGVSIKKIEGDGRAIYTDYLDDLAGKKVAVG